MQRFMGEKVVRASAMAEGEKRAIAQNDGTGLGYMQEAARQLVRIVKDILESESFERQVLLLGAKGNNSGDAYAVGCHLLEAGYGVTAYQTAPLDECGELTQRFIKKFLEKGGSMVEVGGVHHLQFTPNCLIIDGLLGTGFHGALEGLLLDVVKCVNESHNRVLSIDIASGVSGDTGCVETEAIQADWTVALGYYKVGHSLDRGYACTGVLYRAEFGMGKEFMEAIPAWMHVVHPHVLQALPIRDRKANKYSVGEVVVVGGGVGMMGAGALASFAALRAGAGIVRFYYPEENTEQVNVPLEVICTPYQDVTMIEGELARAKALLLGPGMGRTEQTLQTLNELLKGAHTNVVLDADALYFFHQLVRAKGECILTPHAGELERLLECDKHISEMERIEQAQRFAEEKDVVVVCKGAPTVIVAKGREKIVVPYGNPGMATAGSGDVLGGIIASLVAQGLDGYSAAVSGVYVHGKAGDNAAVEFTDRSLIASDIIHALPHIFKEIPN